MAHWPATEKKVKTNAERQHVYGWLAGQGRKAGWWLYFPSKRAPVITLQPLATVFAEHSRIVTTSAKAAWLAYTSPGRLNRTLIRRARFYFRVWKESKWYGYEWSKHSQKQA